MTKKPLLGILIVCVLALLSLFGRSSIAASALAAATATPPMTPTPAESSDLAQDIDTMLAKLADDGLFDGVVLVAQEGEILLGKGYGLANVEWGVPHTLQSKFRIASVTKSFVAIAVMQLAEDGELSVDDSICLYIKDCPEAWQPVTLHHLLSHTSGIRDLESIHEYSSHMRDPISFKNQVDLLREYPLHFTPGSQWQYANVNYMLLGEVIKQVTGAPFTKYLGEHITQSLGMTDTGMDENRKVLEGRATGYASATVLAEYIDLLRVGTAGSMYSTAEDLLRLDQALYRDDLLSAQAKEQMFTPYGDVVFPGYDGGYGYGWYIADIAGHKRVDNAGVLNGFKTDFRRYPEDKITVIVMINRDDQDPFTVGDSIEKLIFAAR